jgi:PEGA domain
MLSAHDQPDRDRSRLLIPALILLVLAQSILIGWWWIAGRPLSAAQPVGESAAVTVTSEPAGAAVSVDGVAQGATPVTLELSAGPHQVTVGEGSAGWTETLAVKAGVESSVHVARPRTAAAPDVPDVGTLEITTEPPGLQVTVDGTPRGASPVSVTDLSPGSHEVAVARGSSFVRRVVAVEAGVPTAVLISTQAEGIASGWLTVSGPVPVQIFENGALIGTSDAARLLLPVGRHKLEFTNDTFGYRVRQTVQITARQAATLSLEPVTGTLSVNAQPWAEVWVDGRRIGETPIGNLSLPIGNHELTVRHPQLGERRQTVAVGANGPSRVGIDLRQ